MLDQLLALCERIGILDSPRNVVDAVDQLQATIMLAFHLQHLGLCVQRLYLPQEKNLHALAKTQSTSRNDRWCFHRTNCSAD
ncbi:hypothetical protein [Variovorax boronicumulans]|uniref:hypothetical protein n=1 Tax=Variovorax boronicumulans TaxID=436515 RepID=UPI0027D8D17E|nr:hypothetical protein [Variovorax boronicumulans]